MSYTDPPRESSVVIAVVILAALAWLGFVAVFTGIYRFVG